MIVCAPLGRGYEEENLFRLMTFCVRKKEKRIPLIMFERNFFSLSFYKNLLLFFGIPLEGGIKLGVVSKRRSGFGNYRACVRRMLYSSPAITVF
jgi:hypothetical protein